MPKNRAGNWQGSTEACDGYEGDMVRSDVSVSVVIPTYNRGHLLPRAIASVLSQTFTDFELIVVDDCSTDNTESVVGSFNDARIKYLRCPQRRGAAFARNLGIKASKGNFIAFQDSDDEWLPEKLEKQIKAFRGVSDEVGVVYTGFWKKKNNRSSYLPPMRIREKEGDIHQHLFWENFLGVPALLVKRACFDRAGMFDEQLPRFQDWELCIRISKYYHFLLVDEPLFIAYCQQDSISSDSGAAVEAVKTVFDKYYGEISEDPRLLAHYDHWVGACLLEDRQKKAGRAYFKKAIEHDPFNVKYYASFFLSCFGIRVYNTVMAAYQRTKK